MRVYFRMTEAVVGTLHRVTPSMVVRLPRYGFYTSNIASLPRGPISMTYLADYIWYIDDAGYVQYLKNRQGAALAPEELTVAYLSAKDIKAPPERASTTLRFNI